MTELSEGPCDKPAQEEQIVFLTRVPSDSRLAGRNRYTGAWNGRFSSFLFAVYLITT